MAEYPKELFHPNGFQTVTVFDRDQEVAAYDAHKAWRDAHDAATLAAMQGRDAPKPIVAEAVPVVAPSKPAGARA